MNDESPRSSRLSHDLIVVVTSSLLAGVIAFAVAHYTVAENDRASQSTVIRENLSAVYLPLTHTFSRLIACVSVGLCPQDEVLKDDRAASAALVASVSQGSREVIHRVHQLEVTLGPVVQARLAGREPNRDRVRRATTQFVRLQNQIADELGAESLMIIGG